VNGLSSVVVRTVFTSLQLQSGIFPVQQPWHLTKRTQVLQRRGGVTAAAKAGFVVDDVLG
jgi:hypothetical protein